MLLRKFCVLVVGVLLAVQLATRVTVRPLLLAWAALAQQPTLFYLVRRGAAGSDRVLVPACLSVASLPHSCRGCFSSSWWR